MAFLVAALAVGACSSDVEDERNAERTENLGQTHEALSFLPVRALRGLAVSPVPISLAGRSFAAIERIGEGSYLVNAAADCAGCHGSDPASFLAGGTPFPLDDGNVVYTRNLTPDDATGMTLTENQFIESMRTGKDWDHPGEALVVMPWLQYRWMSRSDLRAVYAYLRAIPARSNAVPADVKATSIFTGPPVAFPGSYDEGDVVRPLPPEAGDPDNVRRGLATRPLDAPKDLGSLPPLVRSWIGRGSYLATVATCNDCHTNPDRQLVRSLPDFGRVNTAEYLSGGRVFDVPPPLQTALGQRRTMSADLTGATNGFFAEPEDSFARFALLLDTGKHVDEDPPRALGWPMPWDHYRLLLPTDKLALYAYLKSIPPRTGPADKKTQDWAPYCSVDSDCAGTEAPTCATATNECAGKACTADSDCFACQTCEYGTCVAPSTSSTCLTNGL